MPTDKISEFLQNKKLIDFLTNEAKIYKSLDLTAKRNTFAILFQKKVRFASVILQQLGTVIMTRLVAEKDDHPSVRISKSKADFEAYKKASWPEPMTYEDYVSKETTGAKEKLQNALQIRDELMQDDLDNIDRFLLLEYQPPDNIYEIGDQLRSILNIFTHIIRLEEFQEFPSYLLFKLDYAFEQLILGAALEISVWETHDKKKFRTTQSTKKIQKGKVERKQEVIETYYQINTKGMSFNKIATTICENLNSKKGSSPSVKTIKRYLEEDEQIKVQINLDKGNN